MYSIIVILARLDLPLHRYSDQTTILQYSSSFVFLSVFCFTGMWPISRLNIPCTTRSYNYVFNTKSKPNTLSQVF
jgi:hypothetical protein